MTPIEDSLVFFQLNETPLILIILSIGFSIGTISVLRLISDFDVKLVAVTIPVISKLYSAFGHFIFLTI